MHSQHKNEKGPREDARGPGGARPVLPGRGGGAA